MNFNQTSIRLVREGDGTLTSTHQNSYEVASALMQQDQSYNTNNSNNLSALTHHLRKSAFTNNNPVAKSFADWDNPLNDNQE